MAASELNNTQGEMQMKEVVGSSTLAHTLDEIAKKNTYLGNLCHDALEFGISIYRGVIVVWDEDHDGRVLRFVDNLTDGELRCVVAVGESEAGVIVVLKSRNARKQSDVSRFYRDNYEFEVGNDQFQMHPVDLDGPYDSIDL